MNTRSKLVFVRAAAATTLAAALSVPCAAQYRVTFGPADPLALHSPEQWKQLLDQANEVNQRLAEVERQIVEQCIQLNRSGQQLPQVCLQRLQSTSKEQR